MKRIIICIFALLLAAPAAAGWKEDFMGELSAITQDFAKAMDAQGLDASSQGDVANYSLFSGVSGLCVGSNEGKYPVPQKTINEILRVHKMILQGKSPKVETLNNIGRLCLDHMESAMRKDGVSDAEIELVGDVLVKVIIPRIRASMGLPPRQ